MMTTTLPYDADAVRTRTLRGRRTLRWCAMLLFPLFTASAQEARPVVSGMTMRQVREAWGSPRVTNRNITRGRVTEMWIYSGDRTVEFEDGEVRAVTPAPKPPRAAPARDTAGVRSAALDYLEGFYLGDSTRFIRSIRPEVFKYGFSREPDGGYVGSQMRWPQFHQFAARVKSGAVRTPPNAPKRVEVLDIADQTAAVKVTAWWGIDYLLMGKTGGRWMIYHVMWQSPPTP